MSSDRLDRLDYYTLLRVGEDATADAIREAFHGFALRYHPDRFAAAPPAKRERAAEIYRRGAEGYRVLMNPVSRRAYDEGLRRGQLRMKPEERRQSESPTTRSGRLSVRSPRARPFATKALQAFKKGDFKTAKLNLKMALQHEPDNALLKARLADVEQRLG
jgi:curved DNA-binding protein CbpA